MDQKFYDLMDLSHNKIFFIFKIHLHSPFLFDSDRAYWLYICDKELSVNLARNLLLVPEQYYIGFSERCQGIF
jgi:hypothetical protein